MGEKASLTKKFTNYISFVWFSIDSGKKRKKKMGGYVSNFLAWRSDFLEPMQKRHNMFYSLLSHKDAG